MASPPGLLLVLLGALGILLVTGLRSWRLPLSPSPSALGAHELRKNPALYTDFGTQLGRVGSDDPLRKPEVLAPAGGWDQLKAAMTSGADPQQGFKYRMRGQMDEQCCRCS